MYASMLLMVAIATEVAATIMLKNADGFTRLGPSIVVVVGYTASYLALGLALKHGLDLSTGYALWAGLGASAAAIAGTLLFGERLSAGGVAGICLIIVGVFLINVGEQPA